MGRNGAAARPPASKAASHTTFILSVHILAVLLSSHRHCPKDARTSGPLATHDHVVRSAVVAAAPAPRHVAPLSLRISSQEKRSAIRAVMMPTALQRPYRSRERSQRQECRANSAMLEDESCPRDHQPHDMRSMMPMIHLATTDTRRTVASERSRMRFALRARREAPIRRRRRQAQPVYRRVIHANAVKSIRPAECGDKRAVVLSPDLPQPAQI